MTRGAVVMPIVAAAALWCSARIGAAQEQTPSWAPLADLVGDWTGEGEGQPGQGAGQFSFQPDLQNRVLVRRSYAEYPASKDRPAFRHDDLTIIYREAESAPLKAIYFDNEGHVIRYAVDVSADRNTFTFVSDAVGGPRYRLTYTKAGPDVLAIKFEIAPPGKLDAFSTYLEARARRRPRGSC